MDEGEEGSKDASAKLFSSMIDPGNNAEAGSFEEGIFSDEGGGKRFGGLWLPFRMLEDFPELRFSRM